ncbi:hypothetical protein D5038_12450 [Verminephrobacter aporrectodeae subsp. tuberculatae]|uniref:hypothetical protein n=1 Tax=Verminephrobacter aporrectodeae TaxID=1110389 RepID=UPI002238B8CE|nr:hypothetical protein [Verminephrobacter aporrectodeae]MCW5257135.1 hypothetical protein [Verminephrobacter aporrectodeae subsp. tuberculatae]
MSNEQNGQTRFRYNSATQLISTRNTGPGRSRPQEQSYHYDALGQPLEHPTQSEHYQHDPQGLRTDRRTIRHQADSSTRNSLTRYTYVCYPLHTGTLDLCNNVS